MSVYLEHAQGGPIEGFPESVVPQRWPLTWSVHPTRDRAELARSYQRDGPLVWRVVETERGWELCVMPAWYAEAHGA